MLSTASDMECRVGEFKLLTLHFSQIDDGEGARGFGPVWRLPHGGGPRIEDGLNGFY